MAGKTGVYTGLAATLSFLFTSWDMYLGGWELGTWKGMGVSVIDNMTNAGNTAAALAGGAVLGWILRRLEDE